MARDPYKYYRIEARELIDALARGVLDLERGAADAPQVALLLRLAHTLKGAARVVRQPASAEAAHRFEEILEPYRAGGMVAREHSQALLQLTDLLDAQLDALGSGENAPATPAPAMAAPAAATVAASASAASEPVVAPPRLAERRHGGDERFESVRVELAEMDALLAGVSESVVQVSALRRHAGSLERSRALSHAISEQLMPVAGSGRGVTPAALARARALLAELQGDLETQHRSLADGLDRSEAELREVRSRADTLRLVPAGNVFDRLERAVRDAAQALGKDIVFSSSGGELRLDGHVLAPLADALLHVVRNAADHGIESPEQRLAAGKNPQGRIELRVERAGARLRVRCRDDGRGLDLDAVRRAAVAAGKVDDAAAASLDLQHAIGLLLQGGISTKGEVTEISGRGVGMDVLRAAAVRLKGDLDVESRRGEGTEVRLTVPVSLTAMSALLLQAGSQYLALPIDVVRRSLRLADAEIARSPEGQTLVHDGRVVPFAALAELLGAEAAPRKIWTVVVVESRGAACALGVDALVGRADVVVRPLPAAIGTLPLYAGASFDAEGDPQPVLDADGLIEAVRDRRALSPRAPARRQAHILVIDDSLTTRMLEQSILESAGYRVSLATSAEEALEFSRDTRYDLFVVDVEMPGISGFEFVARTRADARLKQTPAVLVSSLSSDADKRRGSEAGASAYIVKGEFDQGGFLRTVRGLVGA